MGTHTKVFKEKRTPALCANCGTPMVCMNKYVISPNKKFYVWHVCSRRKEIGEEGCGHKIAVEIRKDMGKEVCAIFGSRIVGEVRSTDGVTMVIQDNFETFSTWLHHNREKFKGRRVELTMRILE